MSCSSVAFGGSRALSASFAPLVASVVSAAVASGAGVRVGCAAGADRLVLSSALRAPGGVRSLSVFAVGAASGAGFWSGSAPVSLLRAAVSVGASVSWLAGGALSVPLRARLFGRSVACVSGAGAAVFFLASPSSAGSLAVAGAAVGGGVPVFAFSCGFSGAPCPPRGCAGAWSPSSFLGFPCWVWVPAAVQASLF